MAHAFLCIVGIALSIIAVFADLMKLQDANWFAVAIRIGGITLFYYMFRALRLASSGMH